jgi:hypothetical protein
MLIQFEKSKYSGIDGRTYVAFTQKNSTQEKPFQIIASPSGVSFKGTMEGEIQKNLPEMQDFARMVAEAWKEHLRLKPIIKTHPTEQ